MTLKPFKGNPITSTPQITLGIDQSLTSTGICLQICGTNYIGVIQQDYMRIDDMFTGIVQKDTEKESHVTLFKHERIEKQIFESDTYINQVLIENGLDKSDIKEIRMESLAMSMVSQGSIIDLAFVIDSYINYFRREYPSVRLRLVSAKTVKKDYIGSQKKKKKGDPKIHPKEKMLEKFNKEFGTKMATRTTKNPDEDGVDCYVLANKIV